LRQEDWSPLLDSNSLSATNKESQHAIYRKRLFNVGKIGWAQKRKASSAENEEEKRFNSMPERSVNDRGKGE